MWYVSTSKQTCQSRIHNKHFSRPESLVCVVTMSPNGLQSLCTCIKQTLASALKCSLCAHQKARTPEAHSQFRAHFHSITSHQRPASVHSLTRRNSSHPVFTALSFSERQFETHILLAHNKHVEKGRHLTPVGHFSKSNIDNESLMANHFSQN